MYVYIYIIYIYRWYTYIERACVPCTRHTVYTYVQHAHAYVNMKHYLQHPAVNLHVSKCHACIHLYIHMPAHTCMHVYKSISTCHICMIEISRYVQATPMVAQCTNVSNNSMGRGHMLTYMCFCMRCHVLFHCKSQTSNGQGIHLLSKIKTSFHQKDLPHDPQNLLRSCIACTFRNIGWHTF